MELRLYQQSTVTTVNQFVRGLTWSGDKAQASRQLSFDLLTDVPRRPLSVRNGDHVELLDDAGSCKFFGMVVQARQKAGSPTVSVVAYDRGIYLANNDGTYKFRGIDPADAVAQLCRDYAIPYGRLDRAGVAVSRIFAGVSLWQIINTLYTKAGEQTGKRYMARFVGRELQAVERTVQPTSLVIRPGSNLLDATTTRSIINMRNSVAIYDTDGNQLRVMEDQDAVALYGLMQRHITQQDGADATAEAQGILDDNGETQTINVAALGNMDVITGNTVVVHQADTGLQGVFWVDSDTHQWSKGLHTMQLTLNLKNMAYTANAGSDDK